MTDLKNLDSFVEIFSDFQTVVLSNEAELHLLFDLIGVNNIVSQELYDLEFSKLWDLSDCQFPEFSDEEFDEFYSKWLNVTNRENNMNEYGNLIFLQGMSKKWNKMNYRMVLKEIHND